ncbi:MAG: methylmalonyl Co-A mutase-associated GTPase MeaB [bacterium]
MEEDVIGLPELDAESRELVDRMLAGDRRALARLMTLIESRPPGIYKIMAEVSSRMQGVPRVGITGPPGAGKSTLIDQLIREWRSRGLTVGAVAVDPSSPFSGGAVLGDRVRMQEHALDQGVFIRSLGSRGSQGGLSRATMEMGCLLDAFGMDRIMIETVGVGQTELDIIGIADTTIVVLVPEAGDTVQTLKAGLMEIGDLFVINKADRDGADQLSVEVRSMLEMHHRGDEWEVPVLMAEARNNVGIKELTDKVEEHREFLKTKPRVGPFRRDYLKRWLIELLLSELGERIRGPQDEKVSEVFRRAEEGEMDPYSAAARILASPEIMKAMLRLTDES